MFKIATPISHLFRSETDAKLITAHSDCLECRDHSPENERLNLQELFHFEQQIIHPINEEGFRYLEEVFRAKPFLKLASFHVASCCDKPTIDIESDGTNKFQIFRMGGRTYTYDELLENAARNIERIRTFAPVGLRICVENNNYLLSPAYQYVIEPKFLNDLVIKNDINFLYDIAHAHISAVNMSMPFEQYHEGLPIQKTLQVHICKYGWRNDGLAFDAHDAPDEEIYNDLISLLRTAPVEYVTVEYYRDTPTLIHSLKHLQNLKHDLS